MLGLAQFWLFAALGFAAMISALTAVTRSSLHGRLERLPPALRHRLYLTWSAAPLGLGIVLASLLLLPSAFAALGWVADHCHGHDHLHLCLLHPPAFSTDALGLAVLGLFGILAAAHGAGLLRALSRARRIRRTLQWSATDDNDAEIVHTGYPAPLAVTIGFRRPRIFVSDALLGALCPAQRAIVLAHERAHARRRDGLWGLLARTLSLLHLPLERRRILSELHLAAEEACDAEAAVQCGDRVRVAETIVAVARQMQAGAAGDALIMPALTGGSLERRISALLAPAPPVHWSGPKLAALAIAALFAVAAAIEPLHHATESLLTHCFA